MPTPASLCVPGMELQGQEKTMQGNFHKVRYTKEQRSPFLLTSSMYFYPTHPFIQKRKPPGRVMMSQEHNIANEITQKPPVSPLAAFLESPVTRAQSAREQGRLSLQKTLCLYTLPPSLPVAPIFELVQGGHRKKDLQEAP